MAATGKTPILLYGSTTATNAPVAGNLTNSSDGCEIAINVADKNLFFKDSANTVNTVPIRQSSASSNGWLSSTDWTTFNDKAPSVTYTTSYIPYGQGTMTPALSNNLKFDGANFAVGGTQSAWNASYSAIEVTGLSLFSSSTLSGVANNAYLNAAGSAYVYKASSYATFYRMYQGTHKFYVAPSGTAGGSITWTDAVTIDNSANLTVSTGNLVIGTSGKGIDFSATPGTGTSELLADYEEGTWLAVISDGTTDATMAATYCTYTKVGRQVTLTGYIATSSITGITGALRIKGLPFTSQASGQFYAGNTAGLGGGLNLTAGQSVAMLVEPGGTYINLYYWGVTGGTTVLYPAGWTDDGSIAINLTYFVA